MTRPALRNYFVDKVSPVHSSLSGCCTVCPSDFWIWFTLNRHEGPCGNGLGEWPPWRVAAASCSSPCSWGPTCLWLGEDIVLCRHQLCDGVLWILKNQGLVSLDARASSQW